MLKDASRRKFDVLLVWASDRLTREGAYSTMHYLKTLDGYGVRFAPTPSLFSTPLDQFVICSSPSPDGWRSKSERRFAFVP